MSAIRYDLGSDQILTLTIDMPGQSANTMNGAFREALTETVARVKRDLDDLRGIIITSAKKTFFAGGDLKELHKVTRDDAQAFETMVNGLKATCVRLKPAANPWLPPSTAAPSAAGWKSPSPVIIAWR